MRRLVFIAVVALTLSPAAAQARSSYCSPSGDYCTGVLKKNGQVLLRISTFSFSGKYRLCVRAPSGRATCKSFTLTKTKMGIFASTKSWSKHFPSGGKGTYRVRWQKFGSNLGPRLSFSR